MQLSTEAPSLNPNYGRPFRRSPLGDLLATLVAFGLLGVGAYALTRVWGEVPWFFWIVMGPMAALGGLVILMVAFALLGAFLSSLKPTNWLAFVVADGVHLNLRSYRNAHFPGGDPTVLFLNFREVESVGRVTETRTERHERKRRTIRTKTIELRLSGVDTQPIADACQAERDRPAPKVERFGVVSRTKHHDAPVFVSEPGVLRVVWNEGLYEQFLRYVSEAEPRTVDLDADPERDPKRDPERRAA